MRPTARIPFFLVAGLALLAAACGGGGSGKERSEPPESYGASIESPHSEDSRDELLTGDWRIYSETLFFDAGGSGGSDSSASVTRKLHLDEDGTWEFGSSQGTWYVATIEPLDWDRWQVQPYGPAVKIVLDGWNGQVGDGPIEEYESGVDFFWVIYRVDDPSPGAVQMKFGHP